jgi:hypothetical protein
MTRISTGSMLAALALAASGSLALAGSPATWTCEDFLSMSETVRPLAIAYSDGYAAGKKEVDVGEIDLDRETDSLVVVCKQTPKESFWEKVRDKLPGGKKKVKPTKMTCEEYSALDASVQPEVAYWLDGYDAATKTDVKEAGDVIFERDVNVVLVACKQAPKESLFDKIKSKF